MSGLDEIRSRWEEPDRLEEALLSRIGKRDAELKGELQTVLDRFSRLELSGNLSKQEVKELHRRIERWKEEGLEDIPALKLYLRDMEKRSRIREDDALFLWLFSTYGEYYLWMEQESRDTFQAIARAVYDTAAKEAHAATGKDTYRPPGQTDLDRLLSEPLQNGASFHNGLCTDAEYRARQLARLTAAKKARGDPLRLEDADYRKAERVREGWLLRRSEGGHAGYIDLAMTYITGYTVARAFRDRGVEEYRFVAVIDERTTDQCRGLHGKVFRMEDLKLGINAPPIFPPPHPCRSTIRAVKNIFSNQQKSGIIKTKGDGMRISVELDALTPCLVDANSGKIVSTIYRRAEQKDLVGLKKQGWEFNWNDKALKTDEIYKLTVPDDDRTHGLIALHYDSASNAVYVHITESAPTNRGDGREYIGVGGHLFAIAAKKSLERGFGGFIYFDAKNPDLVKHYQNVLGAKLLGIPHPYRMVIEEDAALALLKKYTLNEE